MKRNRNAVQDIAQGVKMGKQLSIEQSSHGMTGPRPR
jgi:hypothetical protein